MLALSLMAISLSAQTATTSFLQDGKKWEVNVAGKLGGDTGSADMYRIYTVDGDTLIGEQLCKKILTHEEERGNGDSLESLDPLHYYAGLYEEGDRVYIIAPGQTDAGLLYDFGLEPGETATFRLPDFERAERWEEVNLTAIGQGQFTLNSADGNDLTVPGLMVQPEDSAHYPVKMWWINGVGFVQGPFSMERTLASWRSHHSDYFADEMNCYLEDSLVSYTWTLDNKPVGIDRISTGTQAVGDGAIYDLSGRRLVEAPEQGIYIQGRKKRIAR